MSVSKLATSAHLKGHSCLQTDVSSLQAGHTLAAVYLHGAGLLMSDRPICGWSLHNCWHLNSRGRQALASQRHQVSDAPVKLL